jgi:hypothetical protein
MAEDRLTPMVLGERRTINGVEHVCVAMHTGHYEAVVRAVGGFQCFGCPDANPADGEPCDELYLGHTTPLCGYTTDNTGYLRRVYPIHLIAVLALAGVEVHTSDP